MRVLKSLTRVTIRAALNIVAMVAIGAALAVLLQAILTTILRNAL